MSVRRRLMPVAVSVLSSAALRGLRRNVAELRRGSGPRRVLYFHEVEDPYSHLTAQLLAQLCERYAIELEPRLVGPPPDAAAPERERLAAYSRKDAADVAPTYGLEFPSAAGAPGPEQALLAARVLAGAPTAAAFVEAAPRVGRALWSGDRHALARLGEELPTADADAARAAIRAGSELRQAKRHYLSATFWYGGEWYWGVDRLHFLEQRLSELGARRPDAPRGQVAPWPDAALDGKPIESAQRVTLEYFPSLRSPYTAIAMNRVADLAKRLPLDLVVRPVLPMVMRGLPVNRVKQLYIVFDTTRCAEEVGEPFGRLCDPVGRPVERAFSLWPWARSQGRGLEFLASFTRAAFQEGIDTLPDAGLRRVAERAGLSWDGARAHLDGEGWQDELERNRVDMFDLGLWGVPSFRVAGSGGESDFCTWGQDRIWLVEQEIRRRVLGSAG